MEDYPDRKIIVVDSLGASLGQGLLVYLAQEKKEQGEDMETVAKWAEENRLHMVHLFTAQRFKPPIPRRPHFQNYCSSRKYAEY